jgi:hypothetical protein
MITKYSIDLKQFNSGESEKITFPTFDQCMMYGLHKLKKSIQSGDALIRAILIEDNHGRKIVVSPSDNELEYTEETLVIGHPIKIEFTHDEEDGEPKLIL